MVLSGNSIEHLLVILAGFTAGVPVLSISTAYSLISHDHARVRAIAEMCRPGLMFADDAAAYRGALDALSAAIPQQAIATGERAGAERLADLLGTEPGPAVEEAAGRVGPDSVAKILFTSGSTGTPKGVITTHRMLTSNQQALGQVWPFLPVEPPVLVDWLPWSHVFGGNHNLGQVIAYGGCIHIDDGRPAPGVFERTVQALRAVAPTVYYNVPAGYALLAPRLEQDPELARVFFSRLRFMFYAAAALPEDLWERLRAVADRVCERPVPLTASWGTTETAPGATTAHFSSARCGCIGVPLPGVTLKLAPVEDTFELRLRGPNVTPGYHDDAAATAAAFDEEGFYRTGDAARMVDPDDPSQGLMFDGRLSEDFKLTSGTWVRVGAVRTSLLSACGGVLSDAVIGGVNHHFAAALAWVNPGEAARACGVRSGEVALDEPRLRAVLAGGLGRLNAGAGSASRIGRLLLMDEPAQIDAGEITDKGYVNQRRVLERRAPMVQALFAEPMDREVITADG
jgi:feruloyl-CoA synthase